MSRTSRKNRFVSGTNNFISDISGQKGKVKDSRLTWDNRLVFRHEWYEKHPQLILRPVQEHIAVSVTRTQDVPKELESPPITPSQFI